MEQRILTLLARTPVHVGAGNSVGAVDSPVMRERHTRIPIIPGSSLKGVLRDLFLGDADAAAWLFGTGSDTEATAGALLVGEARVLAFPVRSAKGGFAWVTCPLALARYKRDAGAQFAIPEGIGEQECLASEELKLDGKVVLEEYCLACTGESDVWQELVEIASDEVWGDLGKRFAVLSDDMFCYFVEHACEVVTRVRIDDDTGTVAGSALFNQENVPSETLFYAVIAAQDEKRKAEDGVRKTAAAALDALQTKLAENPVLQVGGDETVGLGYCSVAMIGENAAES
ncbi:MAG: type III-B CRISPR module RAMP protein Cmr4 [Kiritimatiellaeota bacterium]|nr:type III-B CRISPR module RAMP protein Cmr4 [Kiritimatiellota bacterium]